MKKLFLLSALVATTLFTTSCNKMDGANDGINLYTYAKAVEDFKQESGISFKTDNNKSFYITENRSFADLSQLEAGDRVVAGVRTQENDTTGYDFSAILHQIIKVTMGEIVTITDPDQTIITDDKLLYISTDLNLVKGYLNLYVGYASDDVKNVKFYLAENLASDPAETAVGYLNLELRYDDANDTDDSTSNKAYEDYVSVDMEPLREKLKDKEGILLRINTEKSGVLYTKVYSDELFDDEE